SPAIRFPAAFSPCVSTFRGCRNRASPADSAPSKKRTMALYIHPSAYLRIDAPHSLGTTASGASFATSTGDILEVSSYGPGIFRMRFGPRTRPDYGIVVGRTKPCAVLQSAPDTWRFASGDATLEISGSGALRVALEWKNATVLESITDEHFRGWTRLPAFGRLRQCGLRTAALAPRSGESVYRLGQN